MENSSVEFACFGDPSRFEVAVRWVKDRQVRNNRPAHGGWSTGELRLTVGNHVLTHHRHIDGHSYEAVHWYLFPFFEWLAGNWISLLHEERFSWHENSVMPAATAAFVQLRRLMASRYEEDQAKCEDVLAWWRRHALRAVDASGLYPDVFFRRYGDDIEVSWTARQPVHAPDGYRFFLTPGVATLPATEVAGPFWEALAWVGATCSDFHKDLTPMDRDEIDTLESKLDTLRSLPDSKLEAVYLPPALFSRLEEYLSQGEESVGAKVNPRTIPVVERLDDRVLMFGGTNPDISSSDMGQILGFLALHVQGEESDEMRALVDCGIGAPMSAPHEEGYDLAEDILEEMSLPGDFSFIDIRKIVSDLGVEIKEVSLETDSIRGVALAGEGYSPAILVNMTSQYNRIEEGRRFTLAHELFHILYDRSRAKRVSHTSGPWAPPGVEKRANAFAAMLLMPRALVRRTLCVARPSVDDLDSAAQSMQVGISALREHLYNLNLIDETLREELRLESKKRH